MSRSAAGVDYRPFQVFQKLVLSRSRELYYIGGSDVLPAPLEPKREAYVISRLKTDQEQEARSLLIEHNLRLVVYIARKFDNTGVGVEDLISIGTIGLIKAINTFNPVKNIKLATYASRCIENEILMYLRRNSKTRMEVSIDEPLNVDWDGNELLLSDILGTDDHTSGKSNQQTVTKRTDDHTAAFWTEQCRRKREDAERSRRSSWNLSVLYFQTGETDYETSEKRNRKV